MTSIRGRLQLGLIVSAAILITVMGIIVMFALSQANQRRHETETMLFQLEANAQGLNSNEWEAIASLRIDPDVHESSENFRPQILSKVQTVNWLRRENWMQHA